MRLLNLCALLCALTDLPVLHGFPSGNILHPGRYARRFRNFPRSPAPLRAQVNNGERLSFEASSFDHLARSSPSNDAPLFERVVPELLLPQHSTFDVGKDVAIYGDSQPWTMRHAGHYALSKLFYHYGDDFSTGFSTPLW